MNPLGEEEQDQTADKKDKTNNTDLRPRIGSPHVLNLVEPTVQEEIAHRLDLVYRLLTCQLQIETDIPRLPDPTAKPARNSGWPGQS